MTDDRITTHIRRAYRENGLTQDVTAAFRAIIYAYYDKEGRSFPWRETDDLYRILVSEVMLQQTQTSRVQPKYTQFLDAFPTLPALAAAPQRYVLATWQGLGYNRRALALHRTAKIITERHGGRVPDTAAELAQLPGIGPNTAGAILALGFNRPVVFIETNIRAVYHYFFFPDMEKVSDTALRPLMEATLDRENPRHWYFALYDYGAMLKREGLATDKTAGRQSRFEGSDRQVRGAVLRLLVGRQAAPEGDLPGLLGQAPERVGRILKQLEDEGFIEITHGRVRLRD